MPVKLNYTIFGDGHPVIVLHGLLGIDNCINNVLS